MKEYAYSVHPVGYPRTAAICGRAGCTKAGRVLLRKHEWHLYVSGQRIFAGRENFTKIRVE
jgi:hypothetical protein